MGQGGKPNITQRKTLVLNEPQNLQAQIRKTQILAELFIGTRVVSLYIYIAICLHYTDDFIILGIVLTMFGITAIKANFKYLKSLSKASFKNPCPMSP